MLFYLLKDSYGVYDMTGNEEELFCRFGEQKWLRVDMRVDIWQRFSIAIPDNMTRDQFIEYLEKDDPNISLQDNSGIEYLCDTERPLETEIYEGDTLLKTWNNE